MEIYGPIKLTGSLATGTGDPLLTKDASTNEVGTAANALGTLTSAHIFVGDGSNLPQDVSVTGDIGITNGGVTSITANSIVNDDVNSAAALNFSKMESLTASRALASDASGVVSVATTTLAELNFVNGVTSAIQTQLNSKQVAITGASSTTVSSNLTANKVVIANASGKLDVSATTTTELSYVAGLTSSAQDQLDTKLGPTISSVAEGDILYYNGTAWVNLARGTNGQALYSTSTSIQWDTPTINGIPVGGTDGQVLTKQSGTDFDADWETLTVSSITDLTATAAELNILDGATITVTELNFLDNASANIQTQLDGKLSTSLTTDSIYKGVGGVATASTDLPTGITIGGSVIYRVGGSDVTLADGGTGASLADPGADRIMFWDDSAGAVTWLTVGSGLNISSTTLTASSVSGLTANRIPYAQDATTLIDDSALTWDATNDALTIGTSRIHSRGTSNYFAGDSAGNFTSTGQQNTGVGDLTLNALTSGGENTAIGKSALAGVTSGTGNTSIGTFSLGSVTTANGNTAVGRSALAANTGANNTAIGYQAADSITGSDNVAIGTASLTATSSASNNVAIGSGSGALITGSNNIVVGYQSGNNITSGAQNVVIGYDIDAQSATATGQLSIANALFGSSNTGTGTTLSTGTLGAFVTAPTASFDVAASTTSKASLRIRSGTAPTSPNAGDMWFNGTNLMFYDGSATKTITWS